MVWRRTPSRSSEGLVISSVRVLDRTHPVLPHAERGGKVGLVMLPQAGVPPATGDGLNQLFACIIVISIARIAAQLAEAGNLVLQGLNRGGFRIDCFSRFV